MPEKDEMAEKDGEKDHYDYDPDESLPPEPVDSSDKMVERLRQELETKLKTNKETSIQVIAIKENLERALKLQKARRREKRKQKKKELRAKKQKELLEMKMATKASSVKGYVQDRIKTTQNGVDKYQQQRRADTEKNIQRGREITKQQFKILDKDKDGLVTTEELETVYEDLRKRRVAGERLNQFEGTLLGKTERGKNMDKDYFSFFDNNSDKSITLQEYTGYDGLKKHKEYREAVKAAKFDL